MTLHACNICFEWIFERSIVAIRFNELKLIEWYGAQTPFFLSQMKLVSHEMIVIEVVDQFNINRR